MKYRGGDILKGAIKSGADRKRVTLVDRSIVRNWLKEESEPVGEGINNVLVVNDADARMRNIELANERHDRRRGSEA